MHGELQGLSAHLQAELFFRVLGSEQNQLGVALKGIQWGDLGFPKFGVLLGSYNRDDRLWSPC